MYTGVCVGVLPCHVPVCVRASCVSPAHACARLSLFVTSLSGACHYPLVLGVILL